MPKLHGISQLIETDFGKVDIETGVITTDLGDISYKLYIPETASLDNKAPAVLLLHGYQNDHETSDAYGIELTRRGVVTLAIDEYGHGDTSISMIERGYTNHKVTVTYVKTVKRMEHMQSSMVRRDISYY